MADNSQTPAALASTPVGNITIAAEDCAPRLLIHLEQRRIEYSVSDHELNTLINCASNHWKDFCITCLSLGIPCAINAIGDLKKVPFILDLSGFLNSLFGAIGILGGVACAIMWRRTSVSSASVIKGIKGKPLIEFGSRSDH
jgi:hypothetical protein